MTKLFRSICKYSRLYVFVCRIDHQDSMDLKHVVWNLWMRYVFMFGLQFCLYSILNTTVSCVFVIDIYIV